MGIEKNVNWGHELILTWSKYKSVLCSKKIIQNSSYSFGALIILTYHFGRILCWIHCVGYSAAEAAMLAGVFFSIGGYTTHKIYQEKKAEIKDIDLPTAATA